MTSGGGGDADTLVLEARAKINAALRVSGRRADGFHELETVVLPISLADVVTVHAYSDPTQFRTLSLSLQVTGTPALRAGVPVDETNLALRAAAALAARADARGFAEISIDKRVPSAAGLGGGSADAAAVLRALDALWGTALGGDELARLGAGVGSDVPALLAVRPVVAAGRGERLRAVAAPELRWALLSLPFEVSTRDAFEWWDDDGARSSADVGAMLEALERGDVSAIGASLANDLEPVVVARHPEVAEARRRLLDAGALAAVMTGSGPTVAGLLAPDAVVPAGAIEVRSQGTTAG